MKTGEQLQAKRLAVNRMRQEVSISERRACGLIGVARTTLRRVAV